MKHLVAACIALVASAVFAAAESAKEPPAKEPYAPGLGEFMTATQLRHAKLWFAGKENNWDLAAYEIDEIAEGLEDAEKQFPTHDGIPVADMIKANIWRSRNSKKRSQPGAAPNLPSPSTNSPAPATPATQGRTSRSFASSVRPRPH